MGGLASLAGCGEEDVNPPEQVTDSGDDGGTGDGTGETTQDSPPTTAQASLGEVIESDRLALVAYDVEKTTEISRFVTADSGNEFVVVDIAAKNKRDEEFISFSSFLQLTLRDAESYEYDPAITGAEGTIGSGELAPGEVTRGIVVFEVPEGTAGLQLHVDLDESLFRYDGANIDLESTGSGRTLTQDLRVPVYSVGESVEFRDTRFTPNSVRTSTGGDFFDPDPGNEFVIVDITVRNVGDEELTVSTLLQMDLKDQEGRTYGTSISASAELDRGFSEGNPIPPGSSRRGEIAFEVEEGLSPLYLVMDFDFLNEGDKTFFQLR